MTQKEVNKVLELSSSIKDAKICLYLLKNMDFASVQEENGECIRIGKWMRENLAVSAPAVEGYLKVLQSELDAL